MGQPVWTIGQFRVEVMGRVYQQATKPTHQARPHHIISHPARQQDNSPPPAAMVPAARPTAPALPPAFPSCSWCLGGERALQIDVRPTRLSLVPSCLGGQQTPSQPTKRPSLTIASFSGLTLDFSRPPGTLRSVFLKGHAGCFPPVSARCWSPPASS